MPAFIDIPDEIEPHQAGKVLVDLLKWIRWFIGDISDHSTDKYADLFVARLIGQLPDSLRELEANRSFDDVVADVAGLSEQAMSDHGLFGAQLKWKMANISYAYNLFSADPTGKLLDWVLDGIDALLESMLDGIPGGSAIVELKQAIENSIDRT